MNSTPGGGIVRPRVEATDAVRIALECYGLRVSATELGSNQDRNFLLTAVDAAAAGAPARSVLRVDNAAVTDQARAAQHAAIDAYRAAGVTSPEVLPGLDGELTQHWNGFAVRRSAFLEGTSLVDAGYLAPSVLAEFGELAAASVQALQSLTHQGLERQHMWDLRCAHAEVSRLLPAISDRALRERVRTVANEAQHTVEHLADRLPVQAVHGDLTDDNVMGALGADARLHPRAVIDLGDLSYGWRVAELAVTTSSLLHHDPEHPLRVLETIDAFHRESPLTEPEMRALWPLIRLRATLLVASGHRQLEIDGKNDYARDRIASEQRIFEAATQFSEVELTEHVLARLDIAPGHAVPRPTEDLPPLRAFLPDLDGEVSVLTTGIDTEELAEGRWLEPDAEHRLISEACSMPYGAVVIPYGVYRLTQSAVDVSDARPNWPIAAVVWIAAGEEHRVTTPLAATVADVGEGSLALTLDEGWRLVIDGLQPAVEVGDTLARGSQLGKVPARTAPGPLPVRLVREDAILADAELVRAEAERRRDEQRSGELRDPGAPCVAPDRVPAWSRLTHDPAELLGIESQRQSDGSAAEQMRRDAIFASAQERYYERPMQVERGWRHHLIDTTGRSYVDLVNNVAGLGHAHPGVADAVNRQIRMLNTNSRFLYSALAEYSERLLACVPAAQSVADAELDTVILVNSGSEAVDLALRLAQAATSRATVVSLREAYHGWTMGSDAVTTSASDNPFALATRPDWVHIADVPNRFRGTYRGEAEDPSVGANYAADLGADLEQLAAEGRPIAGFICESVLGNAGGVLLPDGYLADVYERVRAAGGLCIADEVQVGFGRMGSSFWGFERSGVRPDIITIAKPMGNGFPIGGVITSKRIADALATQGQFFSSAGGNPLSCRVGIAVLDAMEAEQLQDRALRVGTRLADGFRALAKRHELIGPVHGEGLYLGVELVRDRATMEPAAAEAAAICERMRELGVIVLTTSERSNVLKVKPPLCLSEHSADFVVTMLDRVLTEGW